MKKLITTTLATAFFCFLVSAAVAQTPAEIMDRMLQEHSRSLSGIETMMTITKMEGFIESEEPDTTYYRKITLEDGTASLQVVSSSADNPSGDYYNFKRNYDAIVNNSSYSGTETIDGRSAHVLLIEDVSALYGDVVTGVDDGGGEPQSGRLYIDTSDYVLLRMSFDMQFDQQYSGSLDLNFKDYRTVNGVNMSFLTEMKMEGISEQFSAEDLAEARKSLRELNEQMENASGMQQRIMERAVRPQLERLEKMLEEDGMTMRMVTLEALMNVNIPD